MSGQEAARVEVHPDADTLATEVAGALLERLVELQADGGTPQVALTGGTIAEVIHRELGRLGPDSEVDWSRVGFWWGDERYVAADSPDRNALAARRDFLDVVGVPAAHVHEVPAAGQEGPGGTDVAAAATAYAAELAQAAPDGLDLAMLGVGPDGHVASLFPGRAELDVTDVLAVPVTGSPKPPPERVSLTLPVLDAATAVWFLVSGEGKAEAVAAALGGADRRDIPAAGVTGTRETVWFLDRAAASRA